MLRCITILCLCYTLVTTEYGAYSDGYLAPGVSSSRSPGYGARGSVLHPGSPGYGSRGSVLHPGSPGYGTIGSALHPGSPGYGARDPALHPGAYGYDDGYNFCVPSAEDPDADCIPGQAGADYPVYAVAPLTGFSCQSQPYPGYYADQNAQCQVFHICQHDGRHDSFLCPNGSIFNQQYFVCDWWYNVDCRNAASFYGLNADLYRDPYRGLGSYDSAYPPGVPGVPGVPYAPTGAAGYPSAHDPHLGSYPGRHGYRPPLGLVDPSGGPKVKPYSQAVGPPASY